ncbi:MAG: hypothetical protein ABFC94_14665 [Syntrophomonas sp.]
MKLTKENINKLYERLKLKAVESLSSNRLNDCLIYLKGASTTAYYFYLGFKDDVIEDMLKKISLSIDKDPLPVDFVDDNCVFYDSFSLDNKGLTQQYIRAIIKAGWNLLYITESSICDERGKNIINEISQYDKSSIIQIPSDIYGLTRSQFIYDAVIKFKPRKLFMHISPNAVNAVTAFYALPRQVEKFQINLTDHTFWIGTGCVDYSLEHKSYGASLSVKRRNISKNDVFIIPCYPIVTGTDFLGFPYQCKDKIIVLSGGAYYKVIDNKDTFFKLAKIVLGTSDEVVILYAGSGDSSLFEKFIKQNCYEDRLILIGYRKDIGEVFRRSDIYLNTYPYIGGLMTQYAAQYSKPILSYTSIGLCRAEEMVCQKNHIDLSIFDLESFKVEARKLIMSKEYRDRRGSEIKNCIISEPEFNKIFIRTVAEKENQFDFILEEERDNDIDAKIRYENRTKEFKISLVSIIRFKSLIMFPMLFFEVAKTLLKRRITCRLKSMHFRF